MKHKISHSADTISNKKDINVKQKKNHNPMEEVSKDKNKKDIDQIKDTYFIEEVSDHCFDNVEENSDNDEYKEAQAPVDHCVDNHDVENIDNVEEDSDDDEYEAELVTVDHEFNNHYVENIDNVKEASDKDEIEEEQVPVDPESIMIDESGRKWTRILHNVSIQEADDFCKNMLGM